MKYDAAEQTKVFEDHAEAAVDALIEALLVHRSAIIAVARTRAFDLGIAQYGDRTFHLSMGNLRVETWDELADAVFYQAVSLAKTAGAV